MYNVRQIADDTWYIGVNDNKTSRFENLHPLPEGVTYNSYLILDEKTCLLDTVDWGFAEQFIENIEHLLQDRDLDVVIVNHMEPDHAGALGEIMYRYPKAHFYMTPKAVEFCRSFGFPIDSVPYTEVHEGDVLSLGKHELTFVEAPMVHWPEVMFTYDTTTKVLFSADAFGTFGLLNGRLFDDELDFEKEFMDHARRYFTNIVGKYGKPTMNALAKAANIEIKMIAPLHGPIWRKNLGTLIEKYKKWATYTPEEKGVLIVYGSMYGHTEEVAFLMASMLVQRGITNIKVYDASKTHLSYIIADGFRLSHWIFTSVTYNMTLYPTVNAVLEDMKMLNLQNRTVAIVENGSWASRAGKLMLDHFNSMRNMNVLNPDALSFQSSLDEEKRPELEKLVDKIVEDYNNTQL
ncbi:MAG: FprA family A-type flavoprotein [Helcococcus sp.]|nr:FprA family A-type flavoprotein [Helcococcus sp.]